MTPADLDALEARARATLAQPCCDMALDGHRLYCLGEPPGVDVPAADMLALVAAARDRVRLADEVLALRAAIEAHRRDMARLPLDPAHDAALYAALESPDQQSHHDPNSQRGAGDPDDQGVVGPGRGEGL